jgi:hypothetical protein
LKNSYFIFFILISIPTGFALTQLTNNGTPYLLLLVLSIMSVILSFKPIHFLSDLVFYFLFEICTFLAAWYYTSRIIHSFVQDETFGSGAVQRSSQFDWLFVASVLIAFIEAVILITFYHQQKDSEKRTFELIFSLGMANVMLFSLNS